MCVPVKFANNIKHSYHITYKFQAEGYNAPATCESMLHLTTVNNIARIEHYNQFVDDTTRYIKDKSKTENPHWTIKSVIIQNIIYLGSYDEDNES